MLTRFIKLSHKDRQLILLAISHLAVARFMLMILPFNRLAGWITSCRKPLSLSPDAELLGRVAWAVSAAARHVPWRANCFPQAIAAFRLLKRHQIAAVLHIGVVRDKTGKLEGHAWVSSGDSIITGGPDISHYTEMLRLPAPL